MSRKPQHLTFANVVAFIALFVALGGVSWAAVTLPAGSVGTRQLKPGAVNSVKVRDGSLLARDFKIGQLSRGAAGAPGPKGDTGPKGAPGPKGDPGAPGSTNFVVRQSSAPDVAGGGGQVLFRVQCAAGEQAVGGGAGVGASGTASELEQTFPIGDDGVPLADGDTPTGWESFVKNTSAAAATATAYAVCAKPLVPK
jgi:hypothetical protein